MKAQHKLEQQRSQFVMQCVKQGLSPETIEQLYRIAFE
jgi:hypothetical protein